MLKVPGSVEVSEGVDFSVGDGIVLKQNVCTLDNFQLDCGEILPKVQCGFKFWGNMNQQKSNVFVVCHALTGHSDVQNWWGGIFGKDRLLDPEKYFIVCCNILGSQYGTSSPVTINPLTGKKYGPDFPVVTVRDTVRLHKRVLEEVFGITHVFAAIGASLGGMQVLEWGMYGRSFIKHLIPIATSARHSPWAISWGEIQREAIYNDPNWNNGYYDDDKAPKAGLGIARMMGMMSYRSSDSFDRKFGRADQREQPPMSSKYITERENDPYMFTIQSYLRYQGKKFYGRFDANCYVRLTQMMDLHDISAGRKLDFHGTLNSLDIPTLVVGMSSDLLYPPVEQETIAEHMPNCTVKILDSADGHDGFLVELEHVEREVINWLKQNTQNVS
eukprot:Nk52_evm23s162 gene=Nk52_evmTU23s162